MIFESISHIDNCIFDLSSVNPTVQRTVGIHLIYRVRSSHTSVLVCLFVQWPAVCCVVLVRSGLPKQVSFHTVQTPLYLTFQGGKKVKGHTPVVQWTVYLQIMTHFPLLFLSIAATSLLPYGIHMTSQLTLLHWFNHNKLLDALPSLARHLHKICNFFYSLPCDIKRMRFLNSSPLTCIWFPENI